MAIDGKILAKAKASLEESRKKREARYEKRLQNAYLIAPRIRILDNAIRETMSDLVGIALGVELGEETEDIRLRNLALQEERAGELRKAGLAEDYLDDKPMCHICNDSGYIGNTLCNCLVEIYKYELRQSLSSLLKLGDETFDSFDLSYYDETTSGEEMTPRRKMEFIFETCVDYARKFGCKSENLFFIGKPGLGKTFLSACIARDVAENGYSVVYDTAASMFSKFEDAKFGRTDNIEEARNEVKRYLKCDLLIIDDLGTEMTNAFVVSALYEVVNTRLITGNKTIVSSNLTLEELRTQYSQQIMSRLEGEYQILTFRGEDIRKRKNIV
jgi:DNA replication protein DnaC